MYVTSLQFRKLVSVPAFNLRMMFQGKFLGYFHYHRDCDVGAPVKVLFLKTCVAGSCLYLSPWEAETGGSLRV